MHPNFLFIGPDKTGSSWLFEYFEAHPEVFVPACKDIYYFDKNFHRGARWYEAFFRPAPPGIKAIGEISHDYILSRDVATRIKATLPTVRLIASLRNPSDRTYSMYLYLKRSGLTQLSFRDALVEYPALIRHSQYSELLEPYLQLFSREQLLLLDFDELRRDDQLFGDRVASFLQLSSIPTSNIGVVRGATRARSYLAAKLANLGARGMRRLGRPEIVGAVKHSFVSKLLYAPLERDQSRLTDEDRGYLNGVFQEDVGRLGDMLKQDYSKWLA